MSLLIPFLLLPGQAADTPDFPRALRLRVTAATVRIAVPATDTRGSGVLLGHKGAFTYVLTAEHVVRTADRLEVGFFADSGKEPERLDRSARVIAKSGDARDLALLRLTLAGEKLSFLQLAPLAALPTGKFMGLVTGCPGGRRPGATVHEVDGSKKIRRRLETGAASFWELTGDFPEGSSGGALVDKNGRVLGICSGTNDGKGYFCHAEEIHRFLRQHAYHWLAAELPAKR